MSQYKSEIILGEDGFFRKRETRESVIQCAENAILDCIVEPQLVINPVQSYGELDVPVLDAEYSSMPYNVFYGYQNREPYTTVNAFVHLPAGFPLPKTDLLKSDHLTQYAGEDVFKICPRRQDGNKNNDNAVRPNNLITFKSPTHRMYILLKNIPISTTRQTIGPFNHSIKAYLFGINDETGTAVTFALPNIYDTGQICTGNSEFVPRTINMYSLTSANMESIVKELMFNIHTTQINNDLRMEHAEEMYLVYKKDEITGSYFIQNKQEQDYMHQAMNNEPNNYDSFHRSMSQEYINQFTKWLQSLKQ
jgi:hypothetical protein